MSNTPQQPTQTSTPIVSPQQQELFNLAMPGLRQFAANVPQRYQGEQVAGFTDPQQAAQAELAGPVAQSQRNIAGNAATGNSYYTSGQIWNPDNNANLRGAIDASVRPIYQNLTEKELPAIRSEATGTGNFGSSRQGIAEGLATRGANQAAGDTAAKLAEDEYRTNVQAQLSALQMAPAISGLQTQGALTTGAVGDVQQAQNQARIQEAVANQQFDQLAPFLQSQELLSLAGAFPTGTQSTGNVAQPSAVTQALGGAATGATLGAGVGSIIPGLGTLAGGALGAGSGALLPFLFR